MIFSYSELKEISDEEIIKRHDSAAKNTSVGISYYLEELYRREQGRQIENIIKSTEQMLIISRNQSKQIEEMVYASKQMVELSQGQSNQTDKMLNLNEETVKYNRKILWLTVIVTIATIINLLIAIMFYFKS